MARRTFDPKVVTSLTDDGVVTDLPRAQEETAPAEGKAESTGGAASASGTTSAAATNQAKSGDLCGRNSCITPLEDRDGILFCVNCGPLE